MSLRKQIAVLNLGVGDGFSRAFSERGVPTQMDSAHETIIVHPDGNLFSECATWKKRHDAITGVVCKKGSEGLVVVLGIAYWARGRAPLPGNTGLLLPCQVCVCMNYGIVVISEWVGTGVGEGVLMLDW